MITLIIVGICLWLYGYVRTFVLYVAVCASIGTLVLTMVVGAGMSALFWPETVRAFHISSMWVNKFTQRDAFELWQAPFILILFPLDMLRVTFMFVWQVPNIFSIGVLLLWLWMMDKMWGLVLHVFKDDIVRFIRRLSYFFMQAPSFFAQFSRLYRQAKADHQRDEEKPN